MRDPRAACRESLIGGRGNIYIYKTRMPKGWVVEDDLFARLQACHIAWRPYDSTGDTPSVGEPARNKPAVDQPQHPVSPRLTVANLTANASRVDPQRERTRSPLCDRVNSEPASATSSSSTWTCQRCGELHAQRKRKFNFCSTALDF